MSAWTFEIPLSRGDGPLFRQLGSGLRRAIADGRLPAGTRLPGTRTLAKRLGVHRNTVLRAFADLCADGWLETVESSGTFVATDLPRRPPPTRTPGPTYPLPPGPAPDDRRAPDDPGILSFSSLPDVSDIPQAAWARAWRRVLRLHGRRALDYADPRGDPALRAALAHMLATTRGLAIGADDVLVTRGSQMALYLVGAALLRPGDVVAVERWGYAPAWRALSAGGARVVPVAVDGDGIDVEALARLCESHPVRAVYVTPHHQYPTTVSLTPARRLRLLDLAARHGFAIVEDDYDHEFRFDGPPLFPIASVDRRPVIYIGTLSKVLAPGLRCGFVVAPPSVLERLAGQRLDIDRQGDGVGERALAELFADGEVQRHVQRMRSLYHRRRDRLAALLREHLSDAVDFDLPAGGMAIWARVRAGVDLSGWSAAALQRGVWLMPPSAMTVEGAPPPGLRLGFARLERAALARAVEALRAGYFESKRVSTEPRLPGHG